MAANAYTSGGPSNHYNANICGGGGGGWNEEMNGSFANYDGAGLQLAENFIGNPSQSGLRHNPGISHDWTSKEQRILEELLVRYASDDTIVRYSKIASALNDKTVRDVALRCRWMDKEMGKRRKHHQSSSERNKAKKETYTDRLSESTQFTSHTISSPYAPPMLSMDRHDIISYNMISGASGQLLEQNARALDQISANMNSFNICNNINLFCHARDNILLILNECNNFSEEMMRMPPLPVNLNEELFRTNLYPTSLLQQNPSHSAYSNLPGNDYISRHLMPM